jgi:hypothetical protein
MTITTVTTPTGRLADRGRTMHVLLDDDQGRLTLRRLRPWHRKLARFLGARLDRELAGGSSPEASASLAARARCTARPAAMTWPPSSNERPRH